jgi:predicted DNA binding protein
MAVEVVVSYPAGGEPPDSAPVRLLEEVGGVDIEVERLVPLGEAVPVYFWGWGESLGGLEAALQNEGSVSELTVLDRVDGGALYSVEWDIDDPLITSVRQTEGALLRAYGAGDAWEMTIRFERAESTTDFQEHCEDRDIPVRVDRLRTSVAMAGDTPAATADQREALVAAYERGYFQAPRETTQEELAADLGMSSTALSTLLRRGVGNLVEDAILD